MGKKTEAVEERPAVPSDVLWGAGDEVTMYAVVPCRGGARLLEMTTTMQDGVGFGTLSEPDVGDLVFSRAKRRMMRQAVK